MSLRRRRYGYRSKKYPYQASPGMIDVFYQCLYAEITTSASETDGAEQVVNLPQPPTQYVGSGQSILYEFLKAEFQVEMPEIENNNALEWWVGLNLRRVATIDEEALEMDDNNVLCMLSGGWHSVFVTSGCSNMYTTGHEGPYIYDFQDAKGNGKLVATQNIVLIGAHIFTNGATYAGLKFRLRLWYRFRKVALTEYIGLLSEQSLGSQT